MNKLLISVIIIVLIFGCEVQHESKPLLKETVSEPKVFFCPRDNCGKLLIDYMNNSQKSIHCAIYDINIDEIYKVLSEKSKYIDVKLVMDKDNINKKVSGNNIIYDTSSAFMHNKFCIFDNSIVWTGSFNPTNDNTNNNVIVIESKNLAVNYESEFNELWSYNFGKGRTIEEPIVYLNNKKYESYFCPEDNCKQHVMDTLEKADQSIYFMIFSFTDFDISDELSKKKDQGLDIKGVVEGQRVNMQYEQYKNLIKDNVNVKKDTNPGIMHHKIFIVDNMTVITGSYNPTKAANEKNDENILIINDKDIAARYLEEFSYLFITSQQ